MSELNCQRVGRAGVAGGGQPQQRRGGGGSCAETDNWPDGHTGPSGEMMYGSPESGGPSQSQEQHTACEEFTAPSKPQTSTLPARAGEEQRDQLGPRSSLPFSCSASLCVNLAQALQGVGAWLVAYLLPNRISFWF